MKSSDFPSGWDEARIREVLDYYESQTDEDAVREHESTLSRENGDPIERPSSQASAPTAP